MKYAVSSRLAIQASSIHAPYSDAPLPGKDMNDKVFHTVESRVSIQGVKSLRVDRVVFPRLGTKDTDR